MSETTAETPAPEQETAAEETTQGNPGEEALGDAGKKALDAMKSERNEARQTVKALEQQVTELRQSQQSQLDAIAKALGLKSDDTPPDPAKLTEQLTTEQANARQAQVQLAVYRNARDHEADADALLDSASFLSSLKDVDPADKDAVSAAIKAAVEANPKFKAVAPSTVPPSFGGGPRPAADKPDPGPGVARLRDAYASSTK